jgi:hypothetical protein
MVSDKHPDRPSQFSFHWEYILTSLLLAGIIAATASWLSALKPEQYFQFIVGNIAWSMKVKRPDYILLFGVFVGFFISYIGLHYLSKFIHKWNGESAEVAFRQLLAYSLLPFGMLLGKVFVTPDDLILKTNDTVLEIALEMFGLSLISILLVVGLAIALVIQRGPNISYQEYIDSIGGSLLFIVFSCLCGIALVFAIGRIHLPWQLKDGSQVAIVVGIGTLLLSLLLVRIWLELPRDFRLFRQRLCFLLWAIQGFFPLFFLILLPTPWSSEKGIFYGSPISMALVLLIVCVTVLSGIDWFRQHQSMLNLNEELSSSSSIFRVLSTPCLLGFLLFVKAYGSGVPEIWQDEYHSGEILLPWWLWQKFHIIPFWDYEPSRGLVNYVPGLLASLFFDGTAASSIGVFASSVMMLPYLALALVAIARTIGLLPAFLACLLMPTANAASEIDVILTVALCGLGSYFLKQHWSRWLLAWGATGIAVLLFAPGQGGLFILSTLPLAGFALWQAIRKERQTLFRGIGPEVLILGVLCLITPLGKMLFGAIRYGVEQSSINSVAHGVVWSASIGTNPVLNYSLWEVLRTSWVLVGLVAGLLLFRATVDKTWTERYHYAVFGIPIVLLSVLFIPRAAGRIDAGGLSRLGSLSIWVTCLLLPILLVLAFGEKRKGFSLIMVAFLGSMLVGIPIPGGLLAKPVRNLNVQQLEFTAGAEVNLPMLGKGVVDPNQLASLRRIKAVLDGVLDSNETYLDLTNHNARYFYVERPVPIQSGAAYNLAHRNQQLRAVQRLEANQIPIVLISADNLNFDGSASLRSYLIYRYVVQHYIPVRVGDYIYLVRPDRLEQFQTRLATTVNGVDIGEVTVSNSLDDRLKMLDQSFYVADLKKIPRSWGQSFETLQTELRSPKVVDDTVPVELQAVKKIAPTQYRITGAMPSIRFDLSQWQLNGRDAGILAFEFEQESGGAPSVMEVSWGSRTIPASGQGSRMRFSVKQGKVLVPLDAAPRWLLAEGITTLELKLLKPVSYSTFSLSNVALFQRTRLEDLPAVPNK